MKKKNVEIHEYWEKRGKGALLNPNATTDDVCLRELEILTFVDSILKTKKKQPNILDLGCGDGFTTVGIAKKIISGKFIGIDYSKNMIANANSRLKKEKDAALKKRVQFNTGDATKIKEQFSDKMFDIVLSSRCLINLTSTNQQFDTIHQIANILQKGGVYISIENFKDGNKELNKLRNGMDLPSIEVRWHNLFFDPKEYLRKTGDFFKSVEIINFSSSYYYATRIIYSKFCQMKNITPDYLHEIHQLAINLPSIGNYSPIKLVIHKK